jgi:hypothetical protein
MALTGELSDLSLAELIEFFCNQRKTGRLKVVYPVGAGYFYLKSGTVVHARIGKLRGIDAVYYALTQQNASFTFSPAFEAPEQTINQPWTSVVLEGLRRMDENIHPPDPFANQDATPLERTKTAENVAPTNHPAITVEEDEESKEPVASKNDVRAFGVLLSQSENNSFSSSRRWGAAKVLGAVALLIAVISVPWGWYTHNKAARLANNPNSAKEIAPVETTTPEPVAATSPVTTDSPAADDSAELARSQREARAKERAKTDVVNNAAPPSPGPAPTVVNPATKTQPALATSAKKVTVQVSYDENGRVTQASGGDAAALRIARQKRFPAGKAGSATITIPIN